MLWSEHLPSGWALPEYQDLRSQPDVPAFVRGEYVPQPKGRLSRPLRALCVVSGFSLGIRAGGGSLTLASPRPSPPAGPRPWVRADGGRGRWVADYASPRWGRDTASVAKIESAAPGSISWWF